MSTVPKKAYQDAGLRTSRQLHAQVAEHLRERMRAGEFIAGERLPTEAQLSSEYGVSRATVRAALLSLTTSGMVHTKHGIGTFVTPFGDSIRAGLQELRSMSDTIRAHGLEPEMRYQSALLRRGTEAECEKLEIEAGSDVLVTDRAVWADGQVVAFSFDLTPAWALPPDFDPSARPQSMLAALAKSGNKVTTAVADLHASTGEEINWPDRPPGTTFLLLDQVHYDTDARPVLASRTYFVEGRFQFSILRTR